MTFYVPAELMRATKSKHYASTRESCRDHDGMHMMQATEYGKLPSIEALDDLATAAKTVDMLKYARVVDVIKQAIAGDFSKPVPSFHGFHDVLRLYLLNDVIDGWLYQRGRDGKLYPWLITAVTYRDDRSFRGRDDSPPKVEIDLLVYGIPDYHSSNKTVFSNRKRMLTFEAGDVARRTVAAALEKYGFYKETPELKAEYEAAFERFSEVLPDFAKQFRITGTPYRSGTREGSESTNVLNIRVVHDIRSDEHIGIVNEQCDTSLFESHHTLHGVGKIPQMPIIRVFDMKAHDGLWVHPDLMTPYVYDKTLRDKLILPKTHRDLLDVLTSDLTAFTDDIIEGKAAGNVILAKGPPGVAKTLTAEVYAELMELPLYAVNTAMLGTTPETIEKGLRLIFEQAARWGAIPLFDEADVYVAQRGNNIEQNAIVAEFLRVLEYYKDLMFLTTNRPNDIDDAILPRCAAVIQYDVPTKEDATKIWKMMAAQFGCAIDASLLKQLSDMFPSISGRDIKMLLRLVLRMNAKLGEAANIELFRKGAMFRAIEIIAIDFDDTKGEVRIVGPAKTNPVSSRPRRAA